ncbi:MAG: tail protein X [Acidobacteriota bacterium]
MIRIEDAAAVITADGDVLDRVCWEYYGFEGCVESVLEANPGIAALGPSLPAGIRVVMPAITDGTVAAPVRLWD